MRVGLSLKPEIRDSRFCKELVQQLRTLAHPSVATPVPPIALPQAVLPVTGSSVLMHDRSDKNVVGVDLIEDCEGKTADKTFPDVGAFDWA